MGDIIEQSLSAIPINCVRKLYELVPSGVKFIKLGIEEDDTKATYELQVSFLTLHLLSRSKLKTVYIEKYLNDQS